MEENHQCTTCYVCEGECRAKLSEEEYQNHPTKACRGETCSHKGHPFVKKECDCDNDHEEKSDNEV